MKFILQPLLILLFAVLLQAAAIEGKVQLKFAESGFDDGVFQQEFGNQRSAVCPKPQRVARQTSIEITPTPLIRPRAAS